MVLHYALLSNIWQDIILDYFKLNIRELTRIIKFI